MTLPMRTLRNWKVVALAALISYTIIVHLGMVSVTLNSQKYENGGGHTSVANTTNAEAVDTQTEDNPESLDVKAAAITPVNSNSTLPDVADTTIKKDLDDSESSFAIIDCIMYNGEPILPTRLELLNATIDRFYITESAVTHAGNKKEKLFKDLHADIFKPYKDKIVWNIYEPPAEWEGLSKMNWNREEGQRNSVAAKIKDDIDHGILPSPNKTIIVNADADEIPDPKRLEELKPGKKWHAYVMDFPRFLEMKFFYFNYNWEFGLWNKGPHVILAHHFLGGKFFKMRTEGTRKRNIPDAGFHLSFGFSIEDIIRKVESFAHQEYNNKNIKNREHIMKSIQNEANLFNRAWEHGTHYDYKQLPVPIQKFHEELCAIQGVSPDTGKIPNVTAEV